MLATPLETGLLQGMFSSGLIPIWYKYDLYVSLRSVQFLPLICGRLLADLDSSRVLIVIIYSDVRDNDIMDC